MVICQKALIQGVHWQASICRWLSIFSQKSFHCVSIHRCFWFYTKKNSPICVDLQVSIDFFFLEKLLHSESNFGAYLKLSISDFWLVFYEFLLLLRFLNFYFSLPLSSLCVWTLPSKCSSQEMSIWNMPWNLIRVWALRRRGIPKSSRANMPNLCISCAFFLCKNIVKVASLPKQAKLKAIAQTVFAKVSKF